MTAITTKFVNPPKPGKKMGNVKTADGQTYYFYADKCSFEQGKTYEVVTESQTWGEGQDSRQVQVIKSIQKNASSSGGGSQGRYGGTDPQTAERIYVCGIVNAWVGRAPENELSSAGLVAITNAARDAWAMTFGAKDDDAP